MKCTFAFATAIVVLALLVPQSEQASPPTRRINQWKRQRKYRCLRRKVFNHIRNALPAMQWEWEEAENGGKNKSRYSRRKPEIESLQDIAETERKKRAQLEEEARYIWYIGDEKWSQNGDEYDHDEEPLEMSAEETIDLDSIDQVEALVDT